MHRVAELRARHSDVRRGEPGYPRGYEIQRQAPAASKRRLRVRAAQSTGPASSGALAWRQLLVPPPRHGRLESDRVCVRAAVDTEEGGDEWEAEMPWRR
jgi:hypothetical protein